MTEDTEETSFEPRADSGIDPGALRCGFVALAGAPNAGKSTLLNALVGSKLSIVSHKVQTTRQRVLGIVLEGAAQLVLVDTPGIFTAPKRRLERAMVASAWSSVRDADLVVVVIDVAASVRGGMDEASRTLLERLHPEDGRKMILALNKIDRVARADLLGLSAMVNARFAFDETFMIAALTGDGVTDLKACLARHAPAGPWVYPEDQLADMPLRLLAAELTREQLFLQLHDELPYSVTVDTTSWSERDDGSVRIEQTILVMRQSQKAIVLGKGGQQIRSIGTAARTQIKAFLERSVHLFLTVKVAQGWIEERAHYRERGLEFDS